MIDKICHKCCATFKGDGIHCKKCSPQCTVNVPVPSLDLAFIRWSVVHRQWHDLCGGMPSLEGFLAGWFCRVCEAEPPVIVGRFRDSFQCGWKEAHDQIAILSRK